MENFRSSVKGRLGHKTKKVKFQSPLYKNKLCTKNVKIEFKINSKIKSQQNFYMKLGCTQRKWHLWKDVKNELNPNVTLNFFPSKKFPFAFWCHKVLSTQTPPNKHETGTKVFRWKIGMIPSNISELFLHCGTTHSWNKIVSRIN